MKRSRFNEEQIIAILREQEAGWRRRTSAASTGSAGDLLQVEGQVSAVWTCRDARRLKALEDENAKLKKLLAEAMLDNADAEGRDVKKLVTPAVERQAVAHVVPGASR